MMRSSPPIARRARFLRPGNRWATSLVGLAAVIASSAVAAQTTLAERLATLATAEHREIAYEEERRSGLLDRPVTVRGRLAWDRETGELTKWVDAPRRARLTLTPTHLEAQAGAGRTRRLPLEQRPELGALLAGMRALLAGDLAALEERFQADYLEGGEARWLLRLVPRDPALAERLAVLEIRGEGDRVSGIDTVLGNGERQHMSLLNDDDGDDAP